MTTVARALDRGIAALSGSSESPRADAQLLLSRALGKTREWIVAHRDDSLSSARAARFFELCGARSLGAPLAYVLGSAGFYGREFAVDARVLVPRPETERLIDEALAFFGERENARGGAPIAVLDVGTGSGAIACTLAAENADVFADCTDVSPDALEVARANARALGVARRCRFHCGSFATPVDGRRFDLVVANLPYVPTVELPRKPSPVGFEPRAALDGGRDGLDAYRRFLQDPAKVGLLAAGGLMLLEAAPPRMVGLVAIARAAFPNANIEVGRDFSGLDRYVKVRTP